MSDEEELLVLGLCAFDCLTVRLRYGLSSKLYFLSNALALALGLRPTVSSSEPLGVVRRLDCRVVDELFRRCSSCLNFHFQGTQPRVQLRHA